MKLNDVLKKYVKLKPSEVEVLNILMDSKKIISTRDINKLSVYNRSTITYALIKLLKMNLISVNHKKYKVKHYYIDKFSQSNNIYDLAKNNIEKEYFNALICIDKYLTK